MAWSILTLLVACTQEDFAPISTADLIESEAVTDENSVTDVDLDNLVKKFAANKAKSRSESYKVSTICNESGEPCIYVINYDRGGWALISATKKYQPILAHSDAGSFDVNGSMPGGLELWRENMVDIITNVDNQLTEDSIAVFKSEWASISPSTVSPLSTNVDHYTDYPVFTSDFTKDDYDRLRAGMAKKMAEMRGAGYTIVTFDDLRYGDLIPGAYGEQGITINDLIQMCEGMTYIYYTENFRFLSFAAYKTDYIEEKGGNINIKWAQSGNYNQTFPKINDSLCVAGCVPVAVGQLMRYLKIPAKYKNFNWDDMPLNQPTIEISDFLYDIGVEMKTTLGIKTSPTTVENMEKFINKYFNYKTSTDARSIDGSLVMIKAVFAPGGHAWLSQGTSTTQIVVTNDIYTYTLENEMTSCGNMEQSTTYPSSKLYFMNWGWGGLYNGYYSNTALRYPGDNSLATDIKVYSNFTKK